MKKKLILLTGLILIIVIGIFVIAGSFNPEDERLIGYEFLDLEGNIVSPAQGEVVHIWNNASISDYFFNKSSGIQLTNHYEEYWSRNVFCIGYYTGDTWNKIKCTDELTNFERSIETDNQTYVNATLWKDFVYETYNFRLGVQYHLGLNDTTLSITIYGKNTGIDIPFDLGFAWKVTDINIPPSDVDDEILLNVTVYPLNETYDLIFKDMDIANFKIFDGCQHLKIDWDKNLNYAVKMYGDGVQENFYIAVLINAGHFNPNQEKSTTLQWVDAGACSGSARCPRNDEGDCMTCGCEWDWELGSCYGTPDPCEGHSNEYDCATCGCQWTEDTNVDINIGDSWKDVTDIYINIGDTWKTVNSVYINIGDSWKTVF